MYIPAVIKSIKEDVMEIEYYGKTHKVNLYSTSGIKYKGVIGDTVYCIAHEFGSELIAIPYNKGVDIIVIESNIINVFRDIVFNNNVNIKGVTTTESEVNITNDIGKTTINDQEVLILPATIQVEIPAGSFQEATTGGVPNTPINCTVTIQSSGQ